MTDNNHVVIAEDDHDDFEMFSLAIQDLSLTVVIRRAENGEVLMQLLESNMPDILFLDIALPRKDGKQCLREIRANKKYDLLPVVMYTSFHDPKSIEFSFREGANIFVIKPSSYKELKEILKRIFAIEWKKSMYFPALPDFVLNKALGSNLAPSVG
jgi:DNA-binding response OmpR family regulator